MVVADPFSPTIDRAERRTPLDSQTGDLRLRPTPPPRLSRFMAPKRRKSRHEPEYALHSQMCTRSTINSSNGVPMRMIRNVLLLTASLVLGTAALAGAQAYSGATVTAPGTVVPGGSLTLSGSGFAPNTPVTITINPGGTVITGVVTDGSGNWTTTNTAPTGSGTFTATVTDGTTTATTNFIVGAASGGGASLPKTGTSNSLQFAEIGAGLVALGAVLVFGTRRSLAKRTREDVNV